MNKCREYAKKHNLAVVGKLSRCKNIIGYPISGCRIFIDEVGNEFWVNDDGIVYVDKDGGCI